MTRADILAHHRHRRAVAMRHNSAALGFASRQAVLETAQALSIRRVERRHETAGLAIRDVLREAEGWLTDEKREAGAPETMAFAGRVGEPGRFAMTCGVIVPVTHDLIEEATLDTLAWRRGDPGQGAQDPRFATTTHRAVPNSGIMDHGAYK